MSNTEPGVVSRDYRIDSSAGVTEAFRNYFAR
jgi:hypothetical protein